MLWKYYRARARALETNGEVTLTGKQLLLLKPIQKKLPPWRRQKRLGELGAEFLTRYFSSLDTSDGRLEKY